MNEPAREIVVPPERVERSGRQLSEMAEPSSLIEAIQRAATDPRTDLDKMERLIVMVERQQDRQRAEEERIRREAAENAYNSAMVKAQAKMRPIAADANNTQTQSKYASYAQIDSHLRPIYSEFGFALSFGELPIEKPEYVRVFCDVFHEAGHTKRYTTDMPSDGKGARGGDVMTKTHAVGSAKSYGKRYLVKDIFNVAIGEEDDDGNGASAEILVGPGQLAALEKAITESGLNRQALLDYLCMKSPDQVLACNFDTVMERIAEKSRRVKGENAVTDIAHRMKQAMLLDLPELAISDTVKEMNRELNADQASFQAAWTQLTAGERKSWKGWCEWKPKEARGGY